MAKSERIKGNRSPAPPKITIGDGSIRDLAYWLMGGDVSTKKGKKKVSSSKVRAEAYSLARAQMQGNSPYVPDYAAREANFNRVVERNRSAAPVSQSYDKTKSPYTGTGVRGYSNPDGQRTMRRPNSAYASPTTQNVPLMQPNYDRRRMLFNQARDSANPETMTPDELALERRLQAEHDNFNPAKEGKRTNFMENVPNEWSGGLDTIGYNMGGPVKPKKRKKKKMYGGKMKKYAKGGGIRKPKYS